MPRHQPLQSRPVEVRDARTPLRSEATSAPQQSPRGEATTTLESAQRFGHRFSELSVSSEARPGARISGLSGRFQADSTKPLQLKGGNKGKGKGKGKGKRKPKPQEPVADPPQDDRNWWQKKMPYLLGGKAPQENRGWWGRSMPTFLGGQPVPVPKPKVAPPQEEPPSKPEIPGKKKPVEKAKPKPLIQEDSGSESDDGRGVGPLKLDSGSDSDDGRGVGPLKLDSGSGSDEEVESPRFEAPKKKVEVASSSKDLDLFDLLGPSKNAKRKQKNRANRKEKKQAESEQLEKARAAELERQLQATRKVSRKVVRHDRNFLSTTNRSGQGKAHRVGSDLVPAGDTPVTATEQLHQDSPNKGTSNRISFASLKAAQANDYSRGGLNRAVHLKFRKWQRAKLKGKEDAEGFSALSDREVLQGIKGKGSVKEQQTARNFATKDGEHQTIGTVPSRFLHWEGEPSGGSDSDSDDAMTDDEA
jgi:hypothetical protein